MPPSSANVEQKQAALRYILDAWEDALHDGIEPEMLANAALFAALADLIGAYGEDAVAYRVVHEALMSTLHHATSANSSVVVRYEPGELQVEVVDDGEALAEDGDGETAGLIAMRAEVAAIGGSLDAGPGEEVGYWVLARLPYEPDWD